MKHKHIAILDFGSQYMHLISRRIRQMGVLAKIYPTDVNAHDLKDAWGVIISGGPNDVNEQKLPYDPGIFQLDIPILGLCYGHQLMTVHYGGVVTPAHNREYGKATIHITGKSPIFELLDETQEVWMSHWDSVTEVPEGFAILATSKDSPVSAMANEKEKRYGFQFHPEVNHTKNGMQILKNFVFDICEAEVNWSMQEYLEELQDEIRRTVGNKKVFLFVSGGVDSSVAFALLEKILGKGKVFGLHVDNGFMRKNESALVKESLAGAGFTDLHVLDASDRFLMATENVVDPEEKRRIIGTIFLDAQKDLFKDLAFNPDEWILGQGTIYPDTIESGGTDASATIKTHHNRVPEIMEMIHAGRVIEPIAQLYKDEVRELGKQLDLPDALLKRWPFPGPGLAIRCLSSDGNNDPIHNEATLHAQLDELTASVGCSGLVMPVKSVGVQGDFRSYEHPALIHSVAELSWEMLDDLSVQITNTIVGVNRVVLHVAGDIDMSAMHMKEAYVTKERLDLLREADSIVDRIVHERRIYDDIWQFPVIMIPVSFGGGESIVLRPIESEEAMTVNFSHMHKDIMHEIANAIVALDDIDAVLYDITNKPPATIEWE